VPRVPRAEARLWAWHSLHGIRFTEGHRSRNVFVGVHDRSIDDKGRLALPAGFRSELGERCYVSLDGVGCLTIREVDEFEAHARELIEREKRGELSRVRRRSMAAAMSLVAIDKQGRITLDEKVRAHAGLLASSSVKVAGMFDAVEVWKPERFEIVQVEGVDEEPPREWGDG
jgi:MraZ protein